MKNILTTLLLLLSVVSFSQTKVQLEVENENARLPDGQGTELYKLKIEREVDGKITVTEKTYNSMEEMKNDPELKDLKLHFMEGNGTSFKSEDGDILLKVDKNIKKGDHKIMVFSEGGRGDKETKIEIKIDEKGTKHIIKNGKEVDLGELHKSGDNVFVFKTDGEGNKFAEETMEVKVWIDEDGTHHVKVNGEEVDYKEWKKNNELHIGSGKMVWVEESEDGKKIKTEIIIKKGDGEPNNGVKVEVIVEHIVLHLEDVNEEDEKIFMIEDNIALKLNEFNFYPNPSNGTFQLKFKGKDRPTLVKVTDISGKEMYVENLRDFGGTYDKEINLSSLKKGIYLLQVLQGSKAVNKKIVIE